MLPESIKKQALFCNWHFQTVHGRQAKMPYDPKTLQPAKTNDPGTFAGYDLAVAQMMSAGDMDGIGIYIGNGISGIDIDDCVDSDGVISETATYIMNKMDSYAEVSPSGHGVHILFSAANIHPDQAKYYINNHDRHLEVYINGCTNKYLTVTGNTLIPHESLDDRSDALQAVMDEFMLKPSPSPSSEALRASGGPLTLSDEDVLDHARQTESFRRLYDTGDMTVYNNDHSSADLALCNLLAFWTGKDKEQMDRLFRKSALYRTKWDRDDYRDATLFKAITDTASVYDPKAKADIWRDLDVPRLNPGNYEVSAGGIVIEDKHVLSMALAPAAIMENVESNIQRVELHYLDVGGKQKSVTVDRVTVANKSKIIELANYGIPVTSSNAASVVNYLSAIEALNRGTIPHYSTVDHMGWLGKGFAPYDPNIRFEANDDDRILYSQITSAGDYALWLDFTLHARENPYVRLTMDASLASALVMPTGALPFVFHLYGKTGRGKTLTLEVAMSIWGNPNKGALVKTMNMTPASMMETVAFLHSIPFAGDELQTIKSTFNVPNPYDQLIMQITEGIQRGRMRYNINLPTKRWANAFLFNGEEPCTSDTSGGGARNRAFEVIIPSDADLIPHGIKAARLIQSNYGFAGPIYTAYLSERWEGIRERYDAIYAKANATLSGIPDKQLMISTLLILADEYAHECLWPSEKPLDRNLVYQNLKTNADVDVAQRAYDWMQGWIVQNRGHFDNDRYGLYGTISRAKQGYAFIIIDVLKSAMAEQGFNFDAIKRDWAYQGLLEKYHNKFVWRVRFGDVMTYAVCVHMLDADDSTDAATPEATVTTLTT